MLKSQVTAHDGSKPDDRKLMKKRKLDSLDEIEVQSTKQKLEVDPDPFRRLTKINQYISKVIRRFIASESRSSKPTSEARGERRESP